MNLSTGNSVRQETSTSVMPPDNCMPFRKTWPHIFQSTSKSYFHHVFESVSMLVSLRVLMITDCLRHVLHKYANEDVSLGAWFIGLDVEHIDDRRLCCGTPPGEDFSMIIYKFCKN